MVKVSIYPDKKLKDSLDKEAKKEGRSLNNLILYILEKWKTTIKTKQN